MKIILNGTIHQLSSTQIQDGGIEPHQEFKELIKEHLMVVGIPTRKILKAKAQAFAEALSRYTRMHFGHMAIAPSWLIGSGTPSMQPMIVSELEKLGVSYVYSHSDRKCIEINNPDGTVTKTYTFEHQGWY